MPYKDKRKQRDNALRNYYKNREKRLKQQKEWDSKNKDKKRKYDKKRRLEKNDNKIKNLNHYARRVHLPILLEKNKGKCENCPSKENLEIHHKRYTKNIGDLMLLCRDCHKKIHRGKPKSI